MSIIDVPAKSPSVDAHVAQVLVGVFWTAVVLDTDVVDPQIVLRLVGQGVTFRQIKRGGGVRLLTMMEGVI